MQEMTKLQKNLFYRAIYMMLLINITIATIIFLPLYLELKKDKNIEFNFTNQLKKANLEEYFKELKAITLQITSRTKAREILIDFNNKKIDLEKTKSELEYILTDALNLSKNILGILRFSVDGILVANIGMKLPNIIKNEKFFITVQKIDNHLVIIINEPIIDRDKNIVGYDIVIFNSNELIKTMNNYNSKNLKSYIGYFKDDNFTSALDKNFTIHLKELNNSITEINQIKDTNLSLLIITSKSNFYAILNNQIIRLIIVVVLILIIGLVGIYLLSKPIFNKLKKEMQKQEKYKLHLEKRVKDEVEKRIRQEQLLIQQSKILSMAEMMNAIAHQWRQPLNIIGLAVQESCLKFQDEELSQKDIDKMEDTVMKEVDFLSETINNFSNFFKPSKNIEKFNLIKAILNIINLTSDEFNDRLINYKLIINEKLFDLKTDELTDEILVSGYPKEFEHIMLNIVLNSKDAIENELNKKNINNGEIIININYTFQKVNISITDNGGGIGQEILNKIFEPYFTTKFPSQGVGVGLYMAKMLIEKNMKGHISVSNEKNGAKFILEIPCVC